MKDISTTQVKTTRFHREKGLYPLKSKHKIKAIFGFDTETYEKNQIIETGSIVGENYVKTFSTKEEFEKIISTDRRFRSAYLCAHNLSYDLGSIFGKIEMITRLRPIERSGGIVYACCYCLYKSTGKIYNKLERDRMIELKKYFKKDFYKITFIDSVSHLSTSLKNIGKIINIKKMLIPSWLGQKSRNEREKDYLKRYNINDSRVEYEFMNWLQKEYNKLGCELRVTISSTSLDLFRRKYLKTPILQSSEDVIKTIFKSYKGGRVETFKRGLFYKIKSYDVNSLYPYIMKTGVFPYGKGYHKEKIDRDDINFEGVGKFKVLCPETKIPFLGIKTDKLYFPKGTIEGYYTFIEIRYALTLGYQILEFGDGIIFNNKFNPFKKFVDELYNFRIERQKIGCSTQLIPKILLNSLYGKFAFKYFNKEILIGGDELEKWIEKDVTIIPYPGNKIFRVITGDNVKIPLYVLPHISSYVTAQARIHMYKKFLQIGFKHIYYSDTDCIFTDKTLKTSSDLGAIKLEHDFKECILVRPKIYGGIDIFNEEVIKVKGLQGGFVEYEDFKKNIVNGKIHKEKVRHFRKLRSALNGKLLNEVYYQDKTITLDDDKRKWNKKKFSIKQQDSEAITWS
jgi:hypothetical protein